MPEPVLVPSARPAADGPGYAGILKSSAIIGGSGVMVVAIGLVRTKLMALLLGPAGVGLMGTYQAIADLTRSIADMGVNRSGVRQIAEAAGSGDERRIATTVTVLRWTALLLGLIGAAALALLAGPLSQLSFGSRAHTGAVALLGIAVFFGLLAEGQGALLQGLRRIGELARVNVAGAALGSAASVAIVWQFGQDGVIAAIVALAALTALVSWRVSRRIRIAPRAMAFDEVRREAGALLRLGAAFLVSGLLMTGAAYAVRIFVIRADGLTGAGLYQAAWTLGGLYVGFVLQSMGTDFYPRLVACIGDHAASNRLVNEQTRVSVLLAGPGIVATLVLSPLIVTGFYAASFAAAVDVLRWICLGMALRVVTWPMGFIIVAKNRQAVFIAAELAWAVVNVGLSWLCVQRYGLDGAGIAFFASYVFHALLVYPIVRRMTGFAWSPENRREIALFVAQIGVVFVGYRLLPPLAAHATGALVLLAAGVYSARTVLGLIERRALPAPLLQRIRRLWPTAR